WKYCTNFWDNGWGFVPSNFNRGTLRWYRIRKQDIIFQQDNDSKHTARIRLSGYITMALRCLIDLNSIEHLWNEIDRRIRRLSIGISDPDELWEVIQK
ncbi:2703_t:CDS:1, partial [Gigaspora margarita]